jgi:hypothetical protein
MTMRRNDDQAWPRGRNVNWPKNALKEISRMSFFAVERARGFDHMTKDERLAAAQAHDALCWRTFGLKPMAGETSQQYQRRLIAKRG